MKKITIFIISIFIILFLSGCTNNDNNTVNEETFNATNSTISNNSTQNTSNSYNDATIELKQNATSPKEIEISSFSTNLVNRYTNSKHNISVACGILNGYTIENGEIFSFWNALGNTTAEKGYIKADSFDKDGKTIQTYGGGVCQVSSTLYNAVLACPSKLSVVERHPHSKPVNYVEQGKDATVSYSSVDFKFQNSSGLPIKIYADYEDTSITIRIVTLNS